MEGQDLGEDPEGLRKMTKFICQCKKRMKVVAAIPMGAGLWTMLLQCPGCSNVMEMTYRVEEATREAE